MFIGHFGIAFGAKKLAPRLSLGTTFLAAQFLDLLWPTFVLLGLETVRVAPGATVVTPLVFERYPISHSLVAAVAWGFALAALHAFRRGRTREALILATLVVSHWALDAIVHVPDLPLSPGLDTRIGLGLWNSKAATVAVEVPLFAAGVWLYAKSTHAADRAGRFGFIGLVGFLALIHFGNLFGPPPPDATAVAWVGQAQWLLVAWAYWVDAHRTPSIR